MQNNSDKILKDFFAPCLDVFCSGTKRGSKGQPAQSFQWRFPSDRLWLGLFRAVFPVTVANSYNDEKKRNTKSEGGIEVKSTGGNTFITMAAAELCDGRHKQVANSDGEEPEAHNHALHRRCGLGIGKFEAGGGNEHFGCGQNNVGNTLPGKAKRVPGFDLILQPAHENIRSRSEHQSERHSAKGSYAEPHLLKQRINAPVQGRDEEHY